MICSYEGQQQRISTTVLFPNFYRNFPQHVHVHVIRLNLSQRSAEKAEINQYSNQSLLPFPLAQAN